MPTIISDPESDSVYVLISDSPISHSVELDGNLILDVDQSGEVVGIDIQYVSELRPEKVLATGWPTTLPHPAQIAATTSDMAAVSTARRLMLQPA